jgi:methylated-DNA-protein-cysteine methyltransferase-like protein
MSEKYALPWYRVIRADGRIALPAGSGLEEQIARLRDESVEVSADGRVDMARFGV